MLLFTLPSWIATTSGRPPTTRARSKQEAELANEKTSIIQQHHVSRSCQWATQGRRRETSHPPIKIKQAKTFGMTSLKNVMYETSENVVFPCVEQNVVCCCFCNKRPSGSCSLMSHTELSSKSWNPVKIHILGCCRHMEVKYAHLYTSQPIHCTNTINQNKRVNFY